ncbi:MAG: histidine--tRNA ligase [Candidatus Omnitrophica bacterium]|nr:histidine--tRNA ligase [Candidatus Omnitrophota bacterium]
MKYQALKGMPDLLPDQIWKWQFVERVARSVFHRFNFQEIRTPILENLELFQRSIGGETDIVQKEMFAFEDRGGRQVVMRPEVTASVARAYVEHQLKNGKLFYIGPSFRAERPQAGRFRQFHQLGAELIGGKSAEEDVLLLKLLVMLLEELGIHQYTIKINSVGCPETCRPKFRQILKEYLEQKKSALCENCLRRLETNVIRILDCKGEACRSTVAEAPKMAEHLCDECQTHFTRVQSLLSAARVPFTVDPKIVRGLDYYNRTVFEVTHEALGAQNALGGGGRYDNLIAEMGGSKEVGASGFACGIERLLIALDGEKAFEKSDSVIFRPPLVYFCVLGTNEALQKTALQIQEKLRKENFRVEEISLEDKPLKKHLEIANRLSAEFVLILGEDEFKEGKIAVKQMKARIQEQVPVSNIQAYLTERTSA